MNHLKAVPWSVDLERFYYIYQTGWPNEYSVRLTMDMATGQYIDRYHCFSISRFLLIR